MSITERIQQIQHTIQQSAIHFHRDPSAIQLLAVTKGQDEAAIREAYQAGLSNFGENYCQEARDKMDLLSDLPLTWHFIGAIQGNKAAWISQHFAWVHTLSREKIAALLSAHRPSHLPVLNVCVQVNLDSESSKSGLKPSELLDFMSHLSQLPKLRLRGLMAIPSIQMDEKKQYTTFLGLRDLMADCNQRLNLHLDTLSMGMTNDMVMAIAAGSTCLRIGRAIFGERTRPSEKGSGSL